ncbi:MAG: hypothetical protein M3Y35_01425 [Actinomycetota bacterium]|nr:hypothetical protein [Actinomycetota bacterium]
MTGRSRRDLSEQMQRASERPAAAAAARVPRAKPVRMTLDLAPAAYRELQAFCTAAAVELERPRVSSSEVLRALLSELARDEDLAARVRAALSAS